jgi:hypothetical protein
VVVGCVRRGVDRIGDLVAVSPGAKGQPDACGDGCEDARGA